MADLFASYLPSLPLAYLLFFSFLSHDLSKAASLRGVSLHPGFRLTELTSYSAVGKKVTNRKQGPTHSHEKGKSIYSAPALSFLAETIKLRCKFDSFKSFTFYSSSSCLPQKEGLLSAGSVFPRQPTPGRLSSEPGGRLKYSYNLSRESLLLHPHFPQPSQVESDFSLGQVSLSKSLKFTFSQPVMAVSTTDREGRSEIKALHQ